MKEDLLEKYVYGKITDDRDRRQVVQWLLESEDHMKQYLEMKKISDLLFAYRSDDSDCQEKSRTAFFKRIAQVSMGIAASLLLFAVGFSFWKGHADCNEVQAIYVPAGQRGELQLADGTLIWLNSNSRITIPLKLHSKNRTIQLNGEAYFSVTRNEKRPFIVQTGKFDIKVLGTEFNVSAYSQSSFWETALLKGKVEIMQSDIENKKIPHLKENLILSPGQRLSVKDGNLSKSGFDPSVYLDQKKGIFSFENKSIIEILEKMSVQRDVEVDIKCPEKLACKYTGKLSNQDSISHILKMLSVGNDFQYTIDENNSKVTIY